MDFFEAMFYDWESSFEFVIFVLVVFHILFSIVKLAKEQKSFSEKEED